MSYVADKDMKIGHTHLKVADLEASVDWYTKVMGLEVMQRFGDQAAFLSAGGYHHHIGLNTWHSKDGPRPAKNATGLFHVAFLYPDRPALARALKNVVEHGVRIDGASDHGVSQAVYFDDPDGNGIEVYWDRAPEDWPRDADGSIAMTSRPLDVPALLSEA